MTDATITILRPATAEITATLKDATRHGDIILGSIYGDSRKRFNDGDYVVTSRIVDFLPDGIYKTLHSTYKVEFAKSPAKAAWLPNAKGAFELELSSA